MLKRREPRDDVTGEGHSEIDQLASRAASSNLIQGAT